MLVNIYISYIECLGWLSRSNVPITFPPRHGHSVPQHAVLLSHQVAAASPTTLDTKGHHLIMGVESLSNVKFQTLT